MRKENPVEEIEGKKVENVKLHFEPKHREPNEEGGRGEEENSSGSKTRVSLFAKGSDSTATVRGVLLRWKL